MAMLLLLGLRCHTAAQQLWHYRNPAEGLVLNLLDMGFSRSVCDDSCCAMSILLCVVLAQKVPGTRCLPGGGLYRQSGLW